MAAPPASLMGPQAGEEAPLIAYAMKGLRRCWMPERQRYSSIYWLDGRVPANQSVPDRDAFYTLNVLLGLSRLKKSELHEVPDLRCTYESACRAAADPRTRGGALGMALWVAAQLSLAPPDVVVERVLAIASQHAARRQLTAQDVGLLSCGTTALAAARGGIWRPVAHTLIEHLEEYFYDPAASLFYNQAGGLRRRFASFASQVYPMLALYCYGEAFGADWAIDLANGAAARLIALQGGRGEWPWFYYVPGARTADVYEVYSVHQHGMAPAFLHHAVEHGVAGAREALVRGFTWLFGANELSVSMLRPAEGMFYSSQARAGELTGGGSRVRRSLVNTVLRRHDAAERHRGLVLRAECRSYELGWLLWSFAGRHDYPELANRPEFAV